jgi:2-(1,2-epoxy-1,2-dihydrophenyl)acetyl-CoA isomerase
VDGVAVGMGLSVALACDVVVASEDATFGAAFRNVGLGPDTGLSYLLPRRVGTGTALELLYTGERIGAAEADEYGLVDRVVPPEELDPVVEELAVSIASGPTMALAAAKELILDGLDRDFEEALDAEASTQALLYTTEDHREGVRGFEEKRRPEFEGH